MDKPAPGDKCKQSYFEIFLDDLRWKKGVVILFYGIDALGIRDWWMKMPTKIEKDCNKRKLVIIDWDPNAIVKITYGIVRI